MVVVLNPAGYSAGFKQLFLFSDAFKWRAILLDIHKSSSVSVTFYPLLCFGIIGLRTLLNRAISVTGFRERLEKLAQQ